MIQDKTDIDGPLSTAHLASFRLAIAQWEAIVDATFSEVAD